MYAPGVTLFDCVSGWLYCYEDAGSTDGSRAGAPGSGAPVVLLHSSTTG